jgi:uncharacterized protein YdeI (YjbR/CyaY-like superfamily)
MTKDKRIDAYVAKSQEFAQPILNHLRKLIHRAIPEVEETIKWGMPFFDYKGPLCNIAAFKQHVVFSFWKGELLKDANSVLQPRAADGGSAMGHFGKITSLNDLPADKVIIDLIVEAKKLNDDGVKSASKKATIKILDIPDYFIKALETNNKALITFEGFSYTNKKEYVEWVTEAKTEKTRNQRLTTAIEWMGEGKVRNWKYLKK